MSSPNHQERSFAKAGRSGAEQMGQMIRGYWISQIVGTFARLGIPDHLAERPLSASDVARFAACDTDAIYRLLRAAKAIGLVTATAPDKFSITQLGEGLQSGVPGSMRQLAIALTAPGHWLPWGQLSDAVRHGRRQTLDTLGAELFQYYRDHPAEGQAFTGAMADSSAEVADEVARVLDVSAAQVAVDVGGASGNLLAALLVKNPSLKGIILDLPEVAGRARSAIAELGLSSRCDAAGGDFFVSVPEADIYLLKYIIHDWDDDQSVRILFNCARALRPDGRVVLVERLIRDDESPSRAPLVDLNMLVLLPGRERTAAQYCTLLARAGLRIDRIVPTASPFSILEASKG